MIQKADFHFLDQILRRCYRKCQEAIIHLTISQPVEIFEQQIFQIAQELSRHLTRKLKISALDLPRK